jgi:D-methionine transport system substrate-binding protein
VAGRNPRPAKDALVLEATDHNPYDNLLIARDSEVKDPRVQKLEQLLHSPEVKQLIQTK